MLILYECAAGFGLFQLKSFDTMNAMSEKIQAGIKDFGNFQNIVKLKVSTIH